MEIPDFEMGEWLDTHRRRHDSVLFIPVDHWIPQDHQYSEEIYQDDHVHINYQGYHLLDSCIVSEILNDYKAYGKN